MGLFPKGPKPLVCPGLLMEAFMDSTLQKLLKRCARPVNWMPNPESWMWVTPVGNRQGFGATWKENPGLANLQWLLLDFDVPPVVYDARQSLGICTLLFAAKHLEPYVLLAETCSLGEFRQRLQESRLRVLHDTYPKLTQTLLDLARRRLNASA